MRDGSRAHGGTGLSKMHLNWFSPLHPERTDIAHCTARLAPALLRHFDITFWTDLRVDGQAIPAGAGVQQFDPRNIEGREFNSRLFEGLNVYNFGNDARFHAGIFQVARRVPGVAVLHDTRLHHFFFEHYRHAQPPWRDYIDLAARLYGKAGEENAKQIVAQHGQSIDQFVEEMPFIEAVVDDAIAVVCHSKAACDEVRRHSDTPVLTLPLPYGPPIEDPRVVRAWAPPWRFVAYGYVNPNRRLESIIRALGELKDRIDFRLDIFGTLWDQPLVEALIARSGLASRIAIHGFVSEQALDDAIGSAHLSFNLRYPTMGEASGGILRSWAHATPALVTNAGWYSDLPSSIALKLSIENEIGDIQRGVTKLQEEPLAFESMGLAARRWLAETHSIDGYAEALSEALSELPRLMARKASHRMLQQVAMESRSIVERRVMLDRAAGVVPDLFLPKQE